METPVKCPHCQSKKVKHISKRTQLMLGLTIAVVGAMFIIIAEFNGVGYYLFALPLIAVGGIGAYKEYSNPFAKAHCHDCDQPFEYLTS